MAHYHQLHSPRRHSLLRSERELRPGRHSSRTLMSSSSGSGISSIDTAVDKPNLLKAIANVRFELKQRNDLFLARATNHPELLSSCVVFPAAAAG